MVGGLFVAAASLIVLAGAPFYLRDILRGHTRPERTTWLIWSILAIVAFFSELKLGARWPLVYLGIGALGNVVVYGLSLRHGSDGWKGGDKLALVIAGLGVGISLVTRSPRAALFGVVLADFAGAVLTIQKAYRKPRSETTITWVCAGIASLLAALSVGKISFDLLLYPLYLSLICFAVPTAQVAGRLARSVKKSRALPSLSDFE